MPGSPSQHIDITRAKWIPYNVEYRKFVKDFVTTLAYRTTTWEVGLTGTHGQDSNSVLSSVAHSTDLFIDEYLRVNTDACK